MSTSPDSSFVNESWPQITDANTNLPKMMIPMDQVDSIGRALMSRLTIETIIAAEERSLPDLPVQEKQHTRQPRLLRKGPRQNVTEPHHD